MIIANPIYDIVFKQLMEDTRSARFFISTMLEEEVESVQIMPQEYTTGTATDKPAVYRLDYIATIKIKEDEYKKVLIEVQKTKKATDIMRFRRYLAKEYSKETEVDTGSGRHMAALPIITIYLLGFSLPEIESPAIKISRQYVDLITHSVIPRTTDFAEKLTHDCYIVQLLRIDGKVRTRLEKMLSVFEQRYFIDDYTVLKEYNHMVDDTEVQNMLSIIQNMITDPKTRKQVKDEQEFVRSTMALEKDYERRLQAEIKEQAKELEQKNREMEQKDREMEEKDREMEEKDREMEEKDKLLQELTKQMEALKRKSGQ